MNAPDQLDRFPVPAPPDGSVQASMARFSEGDAHSRRRAVAESHLARLSPDKLRAAAKQRTASILEGRDEIEMMTEVARTVPVAALAFALGAAEADLDAVVSATQRLCAALAPPLGTEPDDGWREVELLGKLLGLKTEARSDETVNVVALLFQAMDATAGFIGNALLAGDGAAQQTVIRTYRTGPDGARLAIALDDFSSNLPFGAGHHQCPGESHALALAAGALEALTEAGARASTDRDIEYEPRSNLRIPVRIVAHLGRREAGSEADGDL